MKSKSDVLQGIDDELIWRRRELVDIRMIATSPHTSLIRKTAVLRAGVALLYAHWEGFVKQSGTQYLEYVANQRRKASELRVNFIAVKLHARIVEAAKSKNPSAARELVEFFTTKLGDRLRIQHKGVVNTQSNLSSSVLREILFILGLDWAPFEAKSNLIDTSLVDRRNHIAHGNNVEIGVDDYTDLHNEVLVLMNMFRDQITNAVLTDSYLRPN